MHGRRDGADDHARAGDRRGRVRGARAGREVAAHLRARQAPGRCDDYRLDKFGIDSEHDYDPFWAKCVELGVAPVVHSSLQSHRVTRSISSYVYNHIDGLSAAHESLCKACSSVA